MSLHKECADHLRSAYRNLTGQKLRSGHAHEIVAAYFGYGSGSALRAEATYPLENLRIASLLIPDVILMDRRIQQLEVLPASIQADEVASILSSFLKMSGYFAGDLWETRDLPEYIDAYYIQENPTMIEDDLAGEMASTNAFFDELYVDEVSIEPGEDELVAKVSGALNGETHEDRVFHGDKISFQTTITFQRVAGRVGFEKPVLETTGSVDMSGYYDET